MNKELSKTLLLEMKRIREYEEQIAMHYSEQEMRCPVHLSVGQEAVPAALSQLLKKEDLAVSTHRGHAHYLGKGGCGKKMLAEIYGKATGCSAGRGGSMHLIDLECGFKGSTAIVGNTIPVGVGLGLALKLDKSKNIAVVFVGDAAIEEGVFYEAANFAAVKKLPVLFVCENNFFSVYSPIKVRQPTDRKIHEMVAAMGLMVDSGDGNNVEEVYSKSQNMIERIRTGEGPGFVEFYTYRWREHCGPNYDNDLGYREISEFEEWKKRDPVESYTSTLLNDGTLTTTEIEDLNHRVSSEVNEAFEFAKNSPFPDASTAYDFIFKGNL